MKNRSVDFEEEFDLEYGISVIVSGKWLPPRPAPICSDHDHPNFSDPGDPGELEIHEAYLVTALEVETVKTKLDVLADALSEEQTFMDMLAERVSEYEDSEPDPDEGRDER